MKNSVHAWGLQKLFPTSVVVETMDVYGKLEDLYPEERNLLTNAIAKRQGEFAAGRMCAHRALQRLGIENCPILIGENGVPTWPEDVIGSISHAKGCYAAVVARKITAKAIGLDIEVAKRLHSKLWKMVLRPAEKKWLEETFSPPQQTEWATLFFSAKEAFYKFQYNLTGGWLGFEDVYIQINEVPAHSGSFTVLVQKKDYPLLTPFIGNYVFFDHYVATGLFALKSVDTAQV